MTKKISARHIVELCITISFAVLAATTAITTLVFMGHNQHWQQIHDELIATPLVVIGMGTAVTLTVITFVICARISDS